VTRRRVDANLSLNPDCCDRSEQPIGHGLEGDIKIKIMIKNK